MKRDFHCIYCDKHRLTWIGTIGHLIVKHDFVHRATKADLKYILKHITNSLLEFLGIFFLYPAFWIWSITKAVFMPITDFVCWILGKLGE